MGLTAMQISKAKPKDKDYKLSDRNGMYLLVKKNGSMYWHWNYRFTEGEKVKQKTMSFGTYPDVSLAQARTQLDECRAILKQGINPSESRKEKKLAVKEAEQSEILFSDVAAAWFLRKKVEWDAKTIKRNQGILDNWILPSLGHMPAFAVQGTDIFKMVEAIRLQKLTATASMAFRYTKMILAYAVASPKWPIDRNHALDIAAAVPTHKGSHYAAMITPKEIGKLLADVAQSKTRWLTKMATRLSLHWFIRPGELITLEWSDVNWEMDCLQIAPEKMKSTSSVQEHWVPLTDHTRAILRALLNRHKGDNTFIFPSTTNGHGHMSDGTVNNALKKLGYKGKQTAHGLRATARTLLEEELKENPLFVEHQLAHKVKDANGRAYNRTTMLEDRAIMLTAWSNYIVDLEYKALNGIDIKSAYEERLARISESNT